MSQAGRYFLGTGAAPVETLTGNVGGPVPPTAGNIDVVGAGEVTVTGNPGASTLTVSLSGAIADTYQTDAGQAVPAAGVLNVLGGLNINTAGAASTVTVNLDTSIQLPATSADESQGVISIGGNRFISAFGNFNSFYGEQSGNTALTGVENVSVGALSGTSLTTGSLNTCLGSNAANFLTTGTENVIIGFNAAWTLIGGDSNIIIGSSAGNSYVANESSNILIGNSGVVAEDNTLRIGEDGVNPGEIDRAFIAGIYQRAPNNEVVFINANGQLGSSKGTNGQVLIGATGAAPMWATLTAGAGINITNGANSITVSATDSVAWNEVAINTAMAVDNGYIPNSVGLITLTLPAVAAVGDTIRVSGKGAGGWSIAQNAGQTIYFGNVSTTTGAGGSLASNHQRDAVELVCVTANTDWNVISSIGNLTAT